ncbi:MAG: VTT domain-containing protein [Candidatus Bostrichicola ureolyticus]|nr:MAG: VTT domain-containing protein [Candidatus Bostrichicola ureolyticus]
MLKFGYYFKYLFNPEWIFFHFGNTTLLIIFIIIFAETGLFIGFFLPGDSLLFTAGIFGKKLSESFYNVSFFVIILLIALAAIMGNIVGYYIGYKSGNILYKKKDSFFFKKKYLIMADLFYNKYKIISLTVSRFLPIFRTFAPIIAGIVKVNFKQFMIYNIIGALIWTFSLMMAGNLLGNKFPILKDNLGIIIIIFILLTTIPTFKRFRRFLIKKIQK